MVVSTPKGCVETLSGWSLRGPSTVARGSFALGSWAGTAGVGCADWAKWMILSQATGSESRRIRMLERGAPVKLRKYLAGPRLPSLRPRNDTSGVALCPQLATVAPPSRTWNVWWREATVCGFPVLPDRKSTRLNSSHSQISYAVFCLKKKKKITRHESMHLSTRV